MTLRAAVFASGRGSNFEVLAEHATRASPSWRVALLVSDRADALALERARARGVPASIVPVAGREPDTLARDLLDVLEAHGVDLVLLAGYLRLVPAPVVLAFRDRMLNLHPALLPAFGGKGMYGSRVHRAVLDAGVRVSGATVHFVDERYDRGRILAQWPVPVLPGDDPETLAARVGAVEHRLYPAAADALVRALEEGGEPEPIPGPGVAEPSGVSGAAEPIPGPDGAEQIPGFEVAEPRFLYARGADAPAEGPGGS